MCVSLCVHNQYVMTQGIPEYNCFINVNKTVKNFEVTKDREAKIITDGTSVCAYDVVCYVMECVIVGPQWLPWCGYLINTVTLEIRVDYSRYSFTGKHIISLYEVNYDLKMSCV